MSRYEKLTRGQHLHPRPVGGGRVWSSLWSSPGEKFRLLVWSGWAPWRVQDHLIKPETGAFLHLHLIVSGWVREGVGPGSNLLKNNFSWFAHLGGWRFCWPRQQSAVWTGNVKLRLFWGNFSAPSMFQMFHQLLERHSFPLRLKLLHPSVCLQSSGGRSWGSSSRTSPHSSLQKVWQYELKYNTSCGYCVCCLIACNFSFLFCSLSVCRPIKDDLIS